MQSDCKNTGVLKDFHFVSSVTFAYNPVPQRLQNDTDAKRPPTADKDALLDWGLRGAKGSVAVDPSTRGLR